MSAAIYARVSTERQERQQTIESQLSLLRTWAVTSNHELSDAHGYCDEGYSGSRIDRPGLDRLRDAVRDGEVSIIAILSPDRLARKYAYQVLLLEEFRRAGCTVLFLQHPISDNPNDQLLLQIQGAVAEYERAILGERFRRGKLQKARAGQFLGGRPPYGYHYLRKAESVPGRLIIDESESEVVRLIYAWLVDEQMTIRQILKRLNASSWLPRSGRKPWSPSTVHHILADPVYRGTAYSNRYQFVPPEKPRGLRKPQSSENTCRRLKPQEEWIPIPVPALITQELWDRAQAQLARNSTLSFRHNTKYRYLLRCLLTCAHCGLAMFGRTYKARGGQPERRYYLCHGKDAVLSARSTPCPSRNVSAEELEHAVWEHISRLLTDPVQLLEQFEHFAVSLESDAEHVADQQFAIRLERLMRLERRWLDAFEAEIISLEELGDRRNTIKAQRKELEQEREQRQQLRHQRAHAQEVLSTLTAFCQRIQTRIESADFTERQTILQLLIERVIVGDGQLEVRHVIPLRDPPSARSQRTPVPPAQLRSDCVHFTPLPGCADEHGLNRFDETGVSVTHDQTHTSKATLKEPAKEG
jgi:site-specific DNA recombinase